VDVESIIEAYFRGEKIEAALILLAGLVCLGLALWLWFSVREPFARGLAASLMVTAMLGLGVGGGVYLRTDAQVRHLQQLERTNPAQFAAAEGPRIRQVVRSFGLYRIGYAIAAIVALVFVFLVGTPLYHGLAVGLLVLAGLGFTIDYYAEARSVEYLRGLEASGALDGR
jgi:hypothetical protein